MLTLLKQRLFLLIAAIFFITTSCKKDSPANQPEKPVQPEQPGESGPPINSPKRIFGKYNKVASTELHAAFITADSSAWTCGRNQFGQLGDGTTINRLSAIKIMDNVLAVAANGSSTYFIKSDNSLWVCGANITLPGSQAAANYNRPVKIADSVAAISTLSHTLFIKLDSTLWGFGPNYQNQLGENVKVGVQAEPIKLMDGVIAAAAGDAFSVIIKKDHSLWGTGLNSSGALGTNNIETLFRFTKVLDGVQDVSVGYQTTLIIKDDGTLWGTGRDDSGQIGTGSVGIRLAFMKSKIDNVKSISCGDNFSFVIKNDSTLWGTGGTILGQMGDLIKEHTTYVTVPTKIDSGVTAIGAGRGTGFFIKNGKIWGSGINYSGLLGLGHTNSQYSFIPIPFSMN